MRGVLPLLALLLVVGCAKRDDIDGRDTSENSGGGDGSDGGGGGGDIDTDPDGSTDTDPTTDTDPVVDTFGTDDTDVVEDTFRPPGDTEDTHADVNLPPQAPPVSVDVPEDGMVDVILEATDPEDDPLQWEVLEQPEHGELTGVAPALRYVPNPDFHGTDGWSFRVSDGSLAVDAAVVVNVLPVEDVPVAIGASVATDEDVAVDVLLSAEDADGDALSWEITSPPAHGELTGTPPDLRYEPDADFFGVDRFVFAANDGQASSAGATVEVVVGAVNDPPEAGEVRVELLEDTPTPVVLQAVDADLEPLDWSVLQGPAHGVLSGTPPNLTYAPDENYAGPDSLVFQVNDGQASSAAATVDLVVQAVNDPPVASAATLNLPEDTPTSLVLQASDVELDALSWTIVEAPAHGVLSGSAPNVVYTPDEHFSGSDSLVFEVSDGRDTSAPATVSIVVESVDDAPVASAMSLWVDEDSNLPVTLEGGDVDGDVLSYAVRTVPEHGQLTGEPPALVYVPDSDFHGVDRFTFVVVGGGVESLPATVEIDVRPVNDPPTAEGGVLEVEEGAENTLELVFEDVDGDSLTAWVSSSPMLGNATISDSTLTYLATGGVGQEMLTYTVSDGEAETTQTVEVTVVFGVEAPVSPGREFTTLGNVDLAVSAEEGLLRDATHGHGAGITVDAGTLPTDRGGYVEVEADGAFSYFPPVGQRMITDHFQVPLASTDGGLGHVEVDIEVGEAVWFVDNTSSNPVGTRWQPFDTLSAAAAASQVEQSIVVARGDGTTTGLDSGIRLREGQQLLGAGSEEVVVEGMVVWPVVEGRPRIRGGTTVLVVTDRTTISQVIVTNVSDVGVACSSADEVELVDVRLEGVAADAVVLDDCSNVRVAGLELDGVSGVGVAMVSSTDVVVSDASFVNVSGEAFDVVDPQGSLEIQQVTGIGLGSTGLRVAGVESTLDMRLTDVELNSAPTGVGSAVDLVFGTAGDPIELDMEGVLFTGFVDAGRIEFGDATGLDASATLTLTECEWSAVDAGLRFDLRDDAVVDIVATSLFVDAVAADEAIDVDGRDRSAGTFKIVDGIVQSSGDGLHLQTHGRASLVLQVDGGRYTALDVGLGVEAEDFSLVEAIFENATVDADKVVELVSNPFSGDDNRVMARMADLEGTGVYAVWASSGVLFSGGYMHIEGPSPLVGTYPFFNDDGLFDAMGNRTNGGAPDVEVAGLFEVLDEGSVERP